MRYISVILILLGVANVSFAQEAQPKKTQSPQQLPTQRSKRIEHLLSAAKHLEAAGATDDALRIRSIVEKETSVSQQQVMLHLRVIEISRSKLQKLGFSMEAVLGKSDVVANPTTVNGGPTGKVAGTNVGTACFGILDPNDSFFRLLDTLSKDGLASEWAVPTLVTLSGRAASFHSGGVWQGDSSQGSESDIAKNIEYGTSITCVPLVQADGTIRVECRAQVKELDFSQSIKTATGTIPGIRSRVMDTAVEFHPGETLAVSGLVQKRNSSDKSNPQSNAQENQEEVETLFLLTPEIVEPMQAAVQESPLPSTASRVFAPVCQK